ncbi:hypothetical protein os1_24810 [Comamonadaceae bacterium OS-1]|nr:hypothetical protein os1_24810 [Comamonadaceae bacterium OS-1]
MPSGSPTNISLPHPTRTRRRWLRWPLRLLGLVLLLLLGPMGVLASGTLDMHTPWNQARNDSSGQTPDPAVERRAVVQVFGARTVRWRGAFATHPWIAVKRAGADHYTTYQVVGWRAQNGEEALVTGSSSHPDARWYGAYPQLLADHRGADADGMIDAIEAAVAAYPWGHEYRLWPGPNSNTFVAWVARRVPALHLDLPPTAIGKDYLGPHTFFGRAPSGTGWQVSLLGLAGVTVAREEGLELNLLGLGFGIDVNDLQLRLPGFGKVPSITQ